MTKGLSRRTGVSVVRRVVTALSLFLGLVVVNEVRIASQSGAPQIGTPQPGTAQAGTPQSGTPQIGTPDAGTSQFGTPQFGTRAQDPGVRTGAAAKKAARLIFSESKGPASLEHLARSGTNTGPSSRSTISKIEFLRGTSCT